MSFGQSGSSGFTLVIALGSLGLVMIYTQNLNKLTINTLQEAKIENTSNANQIEALSLTARYKSLLSNRYDKSGGNLGPALYPSNYFQVSNWNLELNPRLANPTFKVLQSKQVQFTSHRDMKDPLQSAVQAFVGARRPSSLIPLTPMTLEIRQVNVATTGPAAGYLVESVDVRVVGSGDGGANSKAAIMSARVPVPPPTAHSPALFYRAKGGVEPFKQLTDDITVPPDVYEFQARGSGVILRAEITIDSSVHQVGLSLSGGVEHSATRYDAVSVPIGRPIEVDFGGAKPQFDVSQCRLTSAMGGNHSVSMKLVSVDGRTKIGTRSFKINANAPSVGRENWTMTDYQTMCTNTCPFVAGEVNEDKSATRAYYRANYPSVGDLSSEGSLELAQKFGVADKKLCTNYNGQDPNNLQSDGITFYTYSRNNCERNFLTARTACGCLTGDSLILLGDGITEKRIDQLQSHDTIWNPNLKKSMSIRNLTFGPETIAMLEIRFETSKIVATQDHPFPTQRGVVPARSLRPGDYVKTNGMSWQKILTLVLVEPANPPPVVWNIAVEGPDDDWDQHYYVANGIVTGDLIIQQQLK